MAEQVTEAVPGSLASAASGSPATRRLYAVDPRAPFVRLHAVPPLADQLLSATYEPQAVKRVEIPKPDSAHQAVAKAQQYMREGRRWVVDLNLILACQSPSVFAIFTTCA